MKTFTTSRPKRNYIVNKKIDDYHYVIEVYNNSGVSEMKGTIKIDKPKEELQIEIELEKVPTKTRKRKSKN